MDANLQQTISMYHTGFLICLALAVCFLIVSVILFIVFNIPKIITNRTGRAMRKSMKAIEEKNARTGQLRQNISSSLGRRSRRLSASPIIQQPSEPKPAVQPPGTPVSKDASPQPVETEPAGTDVLEQETDILAGGEIPGPNRSQAGDPPLPIRFVIEKRVILIHSDEVL